jgi:hypothetical protein
VKHYGNSPRLAKAGDLVYIFPDHIFKIPAKKKTTLSLKE